MYTHIPRHLYPPNWKDIVEQIKYKRHHTCQHCEQIGDYTKDTPPQRNFLTVHHINSDPSNCEESNLLLLCQKCHLRTQHKSPPPYLAREAGQLSLPGFPDPPP